MAVYGPCGIEIKENEPLSKHSTFRIGGCAKIALFPKDTDELVRCIEFCRRDGIRHKIIGKASNVLFDDLGFDGAVIFTTHIDSVEYLHRADHTVVTVGCGKSLTKLASEIGNTHSLSGLEFAYGIPGTVGGAVYMNAGAYGGQMSDIVVETSYIDISDMQVHTLKACEHEYSYRHSIFMQHPEYVIISTSLKLVRDDAQAIYERMDKNMTARRDKQPLEYPNAGSTFKRPADNVFAAKLIQDAGLKGHSVGDAQISEKHSGFIINRGNATSTDVLELIKYAKLRVLEQFGVSLEPEIIYVPYNLKAEE